MAPCRLWYAHVLAALCFSAASAGYPGEFYPKDLLVGDVEQVGDDVLTQRLRGKSALIVGGTDGIGRGAALAMAQAGSNVVIVGHSPSKAASTLANMTAVAAFPNEQHFQGYAVDLLTVQGCLDFMKQLKGNSTRFDYVMLTVGEWPDPEQPNNTEGLNKVIALDVVARFFIVQELMPMLNPGARVLSAIASTWKSYIVGDLSSITSETMQEIVAGKRNYSVQEMMGTASIMGDAWMQVMATKHPGVSLIGTFPGFVNTKILTTHGTFPAWATPWINRIMNSVGLDTEVAGKLHAMIITSPNAVQRPVTYFAVNQGFLAKREASVQLEGRETAELAYEAAFQSWVWSFAEDYIANHSALRAAPPSRPLSAELLVV